MWKPHDPLPVEPTFDAFVKSMGGRLISEMLSRSPAFENADYYFPEARVIAELKQLDGDPRETGRFKKKQIELAKKYIDEGKMSFRSAIGVDPLPPEFRRDTVRLYRPALSRIMKKANNQIKSTKTHLRLPDSTGIVILVNEGLTSLRPVEVLALLGNVLTTSYSSVDCLVYLTLNTYVELPGNPYANQLWVPMYSDRAPRILPDFINDLGRRWRRYLDKLLGPADWRLETPDDSFLPGITAIRRVGSDAVRSPRRTSMDDKRFTER